MNNTHTAAPSNTTAPQPGTPVNVPISQFPEFLEANHYTVIAVDNSTFPPTVKVQRLAFNPDPLPGLLKRMEEVCCK